MSLDLSALCGWNEAESPYAVAEFRHALETEGQPSVFGDAKPELRGYWDRISRKGTDGIFLQDAEQELFGEFRPSFSQGRGTCCAQSSARTLQDTICCAIRRGEVARGVEVSTEVDYGISRISIGKGRLGAGDGSTGAWCFQGHHDIGVVFRGVYGSIDISGPREDLAVQWGSPGRGVPAHLLAEAASHKTPACNYLESVDEIADALAAEYAVQLCCGRIRGQPDAKGYSRSEKNGGHATELCAVFLSESGEMCFVEQNSWGAFFGNGLTLKYKGGEKRLRQGSYGVRADDIAQCLRSGGEAWCSSLPENLPRPSGLEDMT